MLTHTAWPRSRAAHFMLLPSLACQASCAYCFGPNRGAVMVPDVVEAAIDWIRRVTPADTPIELTFHGGEPLLTGKMILDGPLGRAAMGIAPDLQPE